MSSSTYAGSAVAGDRPRQRPVAPAASVPESIPAKSRPAKKKRHHWVKRSFQILGAVLLIGIVAFGVRFFMDIARATGSKNPFAALGALQRAPLKNENGRVNILVAGNSADDEGHSGAKLTDSIMVLSLDTDKKTGMILSIPRDLWVSIPGKGHSKINAAYTYGGMDMLKDVVEENLDLPVHYTALVNYTAFKDLVDAVGGITITIDSSDARGIYDSSLDWTSRTCCALAKYPNGKATLDGRQALNLARARGEGRGSYGFAQADFTRTEHQRQMLVAILKKVQTTSTLSNPVKISNIVSAIGTNITTDIEPKEIQSFYHYAKDIDLSKIDSYNINTLKGEGTAMLTNYTTADGQSALIPAAGIDDFTDIAAQLQNVFNATPVSREAAKVVVLNGTDTTGLARTHATALSKLGMNVVAQGNATTQATTTIIDSTNGKKPNTITALKEKYGAAVTTDTALKAAYPGAEIIVVLGQNVAASSSSSSSAASN